MKPESKWSQEEIEYLLQNYSNTPNHILLSNLPKRTKTSIYKKAKKLGLSPCKTKIFQDRSYSKKGEMAYNWNGGRKKSSKGYVLILRPDHHRAGKSGYVLEHILVWEEYNNRVLPQGYCVHHKNGIKDDNRPENLVALSIGEHSSLHNSSRKLSDDTRRKISEKAKSRFCVKENHPSYKSCINVDDIEREIRNGSTVLQACQKFGVCKSLYYSRKRLM